MAWIKAAVAESIGLFIDDGGLAVAVLVWLAICWRVLPRLGLPPAWPPAMLFIGLAMILTASCVRGAGKRP
jgi:hypothetical protein